MSVPKAELHVHVEGAASPDLVRRIAERNGLRVPAGVIGDDGKFLWTDFLDFLNTYGIRLLSPMSPQWFYGDAVFIVDPWLWLTLGAGAYFARRRADPRFARLALAVATLYIAGMLVSARAARAIVEEAWIARAGQPPRGLMVGPAPITPFRKSIIVDAGDRYVEGRFTWLPTSVSFALHARP